MDVAKKFIQRLEEEDTRGRVRWRKRVMVKRRNRKKAKRVARSPHAPGLRCNNRHKQNIMMLNILGNGPNCVTSQLSLTTTITLSEHLCQMKRNSLEEFLRYHSQKNRRSQRP